MRPDHHNAQLSTCKLLLRRYERGRKPVRTQPPRAPEAITFERDYPGTADQAQHVRADLAKVAASCPVADDLVLLASELATNAILHSRSGHPARTFAVRAALYPGDYAWVEVTDRGGRWTADEHDDEHGRGLAIVAAIAGDGNWGIDGRRREPYDMVPAQLGPRPRGARHADLGTNRLTPFSVMRKSWCLAAVTA
jgi:serine/threonine-protein kinase RsbW